MRYVILVLAYAMLGLLIGSGFLYPERPKNLLDFFVISAALIPVLGIFDYTGQSVIDNDWLGKNPFVKTLVGLAVFAVFLLVVNILIDYLDVTTIAW